MFAISFFRCWSIECSNFLSRLFPTWLFLVLRVYWNCSMHQINRISQNLLSRSLVVRQPIVCKGCIRYNRSATLRNSSSLAQRFLPPLRKAQSSPSETPLSRLHRLHRFFRADLPWSHNIVQGLVLCATIALWRHCATIALHCIAQALCKDIAALSEFRIWWFHVWAHPHPSGNFNMK